jgi:5-methylcytosine-specific restriction enzyme subunit McrC
VIRPKIPGIGFFNMLRYALELPELGKDYPELTRGENYYDILVRFLFLELEKIIQTGLFTGYKNYDDNMTSVRGKILLKEHLAANHIRNDRIYCSFSEISADIIENRIIKYTLFYLSHCYFVDETIDAQLIRYYKRLDGVDLVTVTDHDFRAIEYTPLNQHYKTVLRLCELLIRDSALDEEIGEKTAISFLINMNKLFEEFVGNLLIRKLDGYDVELQRTEHPEKNSKRLVIRLDIMICRKGTPLFIMDTKYQQFTGEAEISHLEQLSLYSNTTHIKNCALVYVGKSQTAPYRLEEGITVHVIPFDLEAQNETEFGYKCINFIAEIRSILNLLVNMAWK